MKCSILLSGVFLLLSTFVISAQDAFEVPTTNPLAIIQQHVASTTIEITYHRPSVRGRVIFGELVPYGQVWRTGSDAATKISFSTAVIINEKDIPSGTYELFTIPREDEWTIILQGSQSQWGSYAYDPAHDVARFKATPVQLPKTVESFTLSLDDVKSDEVTMNISWDNVSVPLKIKVDLMATVIPQLEVALAGEGRRPYFLAAMFYYENNLDIDKAAELMEKALENKPDHIGMLYRYALILERKGDIAGAKAAAEHSLHEAASANPELQAEYKKLNSTLLARLEETK